MAFLATFANLLALIVSARMTGDAAGSVTLGIDVAPELLTGTIRLFSASWLLFYLAPTVYFTFAPRPPAPLLPRDRKA